MKVENNIFYSEIIELLKNSRNKVKQFIDSTMVYTYSEG